MQPIKFPPWLQQIVATMGGGGLFLVTFLDSSILSFPILADALVIRLSMTNPARMPYYAIMAALGSLAGCILLYLLARKGGEVYFRRHAGGKASRIRHWVEKNAFLSIFLPAILPPPVPFKPFILAAAVFQVPLGTFVIALLLGRGLRYLAEGILAVKYGEATLHFILNHGRVFAVSALGLVLLLYLVHLAFFRDSSHAQ
jgi:membrane protein YqaA with SNARE-associated domain